jgi:hypothetical protein
MNQLKSHPLKEMKQQASTMKSCHDEPLPTTLSNSLPQQLEH